MTSALAMLGERGIGPDMVLRGFLVPAVATQLLYDLRLSVWAMESGSDEPLPSAPEMQPWLRYVEDCLSRCGGVGGEITLDHLMNETREGARRRARKAWLDDPQNAVWGNALAFCSIPDDPELAIRLLSAVSNEVENVSRSVNLAAAHIVPGDLDGARKHFHSIEGNVAAWYWEPDSLWSGDPVAVEIEPVRWLEGAREVLRMASEARESAG